MKNSRNDGITLIALIITIIVLLILAGVAIGAIVGDNGIAGKAVDSKEKTIIGREKEAIALSWDALYSHQLVNGIEITNVSFQEELNKNGNDTTVEYDEEGNFLITFNDTKHEYKVDKIGNINKNEVVYYTITYVLNGGTNPQEQITTYQEGSTIKLLTPTKTNAYFAGWYETESFTTDRIITIYNRTGNITLYAKWQEAAPDGYFTWTTSATGATVTGFSSTGLAAYNAGELANLAIPFTHDNLPVISASNNAFNNKSNIVSLYLPDTITSMSNSAFGNCTGLRELTLAISTFTGYVHQGGWSPGYMPFYNTTGITKVNFTKGTGIGYTYGYSSYDTTPWYLSRDHAIEFTFEEGITSIGNYTFQSCTGFTASTADVGISNLTSIGEYAFSGCSHLSGDVYLDHTTFGKEAFKNCVELTNVRLNIDNFGIPEAAFNGCTGIQTIEIGDKITSIARCAFQNCTSVTKIEIGTGISSIGDSAFGSCSNIDEITIPISTFAGYFHQGGWSPGYMPFYEVSGVRKIHFTAGTGIGYAYGYYSYDTTPWYLSRSNDIEVTIDSNITSIGNYMFNQCTGLRKIIYNNEEYTSLGPFVSAFNANGGTIGSDAFTNVGM